MCLLNSFLQKSEYKILKKKKRQRGISLFPEPFQKKKKKKIIPGTCPGPGLIYKRKAGRPITEGQYIIQLHINRTLYSSMSITGIQGQLLEITGK
jgi:hypothetical protein